MEIKTGRDEVPQVVTYLKVIVGTSEFRISENKFGGITINKQGDDTDAITITPNTNNQITIQ